MIEGGYLDNSGAGATWVFTRYANIWAQQGSKLVASDMIGLAEQGWAVALSANSSTTLIGGRDDNSNLGAVWVFGQDSSSICSSISDSITQAICPGDTFVFGSSRLSVPGFYTDTFYTTIGACDSIVTLHLVILDSSTAYFYIIPSGIPHQWYIILPVVSYSSTYTWQWGDSSSSVGSGASHTYDTAGYYNICLTVTDSAGCFSTYCDTAVHLFKDQSGQMVYVNVLQYPGGINPIPTGNYNYLYPNPNKGSFDFQTSGSIGSTYTISDMLGHIIMQRSVRSDNEAIEMPDAADGVYTLTVKDAPPVRFVIAR